MLRYILIIILVLLSACTKTGDVIPSRDSTSTRVPYTQVVPPIRQVALSQHGLDILSSYSGSYALLIGESKYTNGWSSLGAIPDELKDVEKILIAQGFKVEKSFDLGYEALKARFDTFINQYGFDEDNRLLFFYSGHGHTRHDKGYLVPVDAADPNYDEKGFLQKAVGMNQVLTWARRIEAKHVLFLFDSCFSGSVFKAKNLPKIPTQISDAAEEPVRQFITAGSAYEVVPAISVFTPAFVDALRYGWGDLFKDGYITGEELGLYLKNKVPQYSSQTPQYGKINDYKLSRGDFVFVVGAKQVVAQVTPPIVPVRPVPVVTPPPPIIISDSDGDGVADNLDDCPYNTRQELSNGIEQSGCPIDSDYDGIEDYRDSCPNTPYGTKVKSNGCPAQIVLQPGDTFQDRLKDGGLAPKMVMIPAGSFQMGDIQGASDKKPVHRVINYQFAAGKYEVTVGEYLRFARAVNKHFPKWLEKGNNYNIHTGSSNYYKQFGTALTNENHPIVGISWNDANAYTKWLVKQTGKEYRLPSEAEWEYVARAGTTTKYWWGNSIGKNKANCNSNCGDNFNYTAPVGSFSPNQFGLYDTVGNVWEWCADKWHDNYINAPTNGSVWDYAISNKERVVRGGSWGYDPDLARAAFRGWYVRGNSLGNIGFRVVLVVRTL
ncbi:MAG: SUMF1/EgtB/PvdO family nonheme iron enzyme [Thiomargarita sp.]|nr:SUMF1/EgtB/PvdO family nonheme iron enzyme [Thiomargarita sp.]